MNIYMIEGVYIYSEDTAYQNGELNLYSENRKLNIACAEMVDKAINGKNKNRAEIRFLLTIGYLEFS